MLEKINFTNTVKLLCDVLNNKYEDSQNIFINDLPNDIKQKFFCTCQNLELDYLEDKQVSIIDLFAQNQNMNIASTVHEVVLSIFNALSPFQQYYLCVAYPFLETSLELLKTVQENSLDKFFDVKKASFFLPWMKRECGAEQLSVPFEIAKLCALQDGGMTAQYIQGFDIKKQVDRVEIAKLCALQDGDMTASFIRDFDITESSDRVEIAKLCAQGNGGATAKYIENFDIIESSDHVEIAKLCAQQNGWATVKYIENFDIIESSDHVEIAKLCAQQNGWATAKYIENFDITESSDLVEIANLCAQQNGGMTAQYIKKFGIKEQSDRVEIAKLCALQDGDMTAQYIQRFGIKEQSDRVEIAKLCAQKNGEKTAQYIQNFEIQDEELLKQVQAICIAESSFALTSIAKLDSEPFIRNIEEENSYQLLQELKERALSHFGSESQFLTLIATLEKKTPHIQLQIGSWLVSLLFVFEYAFKKDDREAFIRSPFIQSLGKLAHPELRKHLTVEFTRLCQEDNVSLAFIQNIGRPKNLKSKNKQIASPERCALSFVLYLLETSGVFPEVLRNIENNFPALFPNSKMLTLIELFYRLHTSLCLTANEKEVLLVMLDRGEKENKNEKIEKVYALLAVLLLKEEKGLVQQNSISLYASQVLQKNLSLESNFVDMEKFHHYFSPKRNPSALFIYAAQLSSLKDPDIMKDLGRYVSSVLNDRFVEERYILEGNVHLTKLAEEHSSVLELWKQTLDPVKTLVVTDQQEARFDAKHWLKEKLMIDNHMDLSAIPNIGALLQEKNIIEAPLSPLECALQELINAGTREKQKLAFIEIEKHLGNNQFGRDVREQISVLARKVFKASEEVTVVDSEDYVDLLLAGTEVIGSCLNVNDSVVFNKGLLGYILDGKNRLVAIKDAAGKIIARAKLSLLVDEENNPVLFLERFYTQKRYEKQCISLLIEAATRKAAVLNIPLTALKSEENPKNKAYGKKLIALESSVSYEYVDAVTDVRSKGHYEIFKNETIVHFSPLANV